MSIQIRSWTGVPAGLPGQRKVVPAPTLRLMIAVEGVALTTVAYGVNGWLSLGVVLALFAAAQPENLLGWLLIGFLAAGELTRHDTLNWHLLAILAGLHLVYVTSVLAAQVPWRAWLAIDVFKAPLLRFAMIQLPCQLTTVVAMVVLAPSGHGHRPINAAVIAPIGTLALLALAFAMLRLRPEASLSSNRHQQ
ncbi:MAG: hypothetical protein ACP5H2_06905 [Solirubrobacteraceae bacterium]